MRKSVVVSIGSPPGTVVEVLTFGAAVHRLMLTGGDGVRRNVVLGHPSVDDRMRSPHYIGGTIGRVANRIAGGRFELDGRVVHVPLNDRGNALHGGPQGFDKQLWDVANVGGDHVTLRLASPDGHMGFPGTLTVEVTYRVTGSTVRIEQRATVDAATAVALTNHAYFNLDGEGVGSIDNHVLQVPAVYYTLTDENDTPTGGEGKVEGTPLDFRLPTPLGSRVRSGHQLLAAPQGIDHNLVVAGKGMRRMATLESQTARSQVEIWSDQPCLQVYTGNKLDGRTHGTRGSTYRQGNGIALEPQNHPDAVNAPRVPSPVLRPGELYESIIEWRFAEM